MTSNNEFGASLGPERICKHTSILPPPPPPEPQHSPLGAYAPRNPHCHYQLTRGRECHTVTTPSTQASRLANSKNTITNLTENVEGVQLLQLFLHPLQN